MKDHLHKMEAVLWMTRDFYLLGLSSLTGWLAADRSPNLLRFMAAFTGVALACALLYLLNDILDYPKDRAASVYRPIVLGAISLKEAKVAALALAGTSLAALGVIAADRRQFIIGVSAIATLVALDVLYSRFKHFGFLASLLVGMIYVTLVLLGWELGGRGNLGIIAIVCCEAFAGGVAANTRAAIRDVDSDPTVGYRTLAVRVGPKAAFLFQGGLVFTAFMLTLLLIFLTPSGPWVLPLYLFVFAMSGIRFVRAFSVVSERDRGRRQRSADLQSFELWQMRRVMLPMCVLSPVIGVTAFAAVELTNLVHAGWYRNRIKSGKLVENRSSLQELGK